MIASSVLNRLALVRRLGMRQRVQKFILALRAKLIARSQIVESPSIESVVDIERSPRRSSSEYQHNKDLSELFKTTEIL